MKLATLRDGSRDGQLAVVSRDLSQAHFAAGIAGTLRALLDDWNFVSPQLEDLYATLNGGKARHAFPFDPQQCMAPLPRTFRRARPVGDALALEEMAGDGSTAPSRSCDIAVVTGDVAAGTSPENALDAVRLLLLHAGRSFAPLAITPDEAGAAWQGGRWHGALSAGAGTGAPAPHHAGELIAWLARSAALGAGSIVSCGCAFDAPAPDLAQVHALLADGSSAFGPLALRID